MYSTLGLVIFVAVEAIGTCFTKICHDHFNSNSIRAAADAKTNIISCACEAALTEIYCYLVFKEVVRYVAHLGCAIHSLQWSTISRTGRHSAGYN